MSDAEGLHIVLMVVFPLLFIAQDFLRIYSSN